MERRVVEDCRIIVAQLDAVAGGEIGGPLRSSHDGRMNAHTVGFALYRLDDTTAPSSQPNNSKRQDPDLPRVSGNDRVSTLLPA